MIMNQYKKGAALIWAVIFCSILMIIATTITSFIVKESRFSYKIGESYVVYAAAKSGISLAEEFVKAQNIVSSPDPVQILKRYKIDDIEMDVVIEKDTTGCPIDDNRYCITSTAQSNNITRKIASQSKQFNPNLGLTTEYMELSDNLEAFYNGGESFSVKFDTWGAAVTSTGWNFGLQNDDGDYIKVVFGSAVDGGGVWLEGQKIGEPIIPSSPIILKPPTDEPFQFTAYLEYKKDTTATLMIERRDTVGFDWPTSCVGMTSIDLTAVDFGSFTKISSSNTFKKIDWFDLTAEVDSYVFQDSGDLEIYIANIETNGIDIVTPPPTPPVVVVPPPTPPEPIVAICEIWGEDDPSRAGSATWDNPDNIFSELESSYARLNSPNGFDDWGHITVDYGGIVPAGSEIKYRVRTNRGNQRKFRIYTRADECGTGESTSGWELLFGSTVPDDNVFRGDSVAATSQFRYVRFDYLFGGGYSENSTFDIYSVRNLY